MANGIKECYLSVKQSFHEADNILEGVAQDYFEMVLAVNYPVENSWKQPFEKEVQDGVNGSYPNKYKAAWDRILTKGIENYSISDMDITIISAMLKGGCFREESKVVRDRLDFLKRTRNEKAHEFKNIDESDIAALKDAGDRMHEWTQRAIKGCREFINAVVNLQNTSAKPIPSYADRLAYQNSYRTKLSSLESRARESHDDLVYAIRSCNQIEQTPATQTSPVVPTQPAVATAPVQENNPPKLVLSLGKHEDHEVVWAKNYDGSLLNSFTFSWSFKRANGTSKIEIKRYAGAHLDIKSFRPGDTIFCEGKSGLNQGLILQASITLSGRDSGHTQKPEKQTNTIDRNPSVEAIVALPIKIEIKKVIEESEGATYPVFKAIMSDDISLSAYWWITTEESKIEKTYRLFYGGPGRDTCKVPRKYINQRYMCVAYRENEPIARSDFSDPVLKRDFNSPVAPVELSGSVHIEGECSYGQTLTGKVERANTSSPLRFKWFRESEIVGTDTTICLNEKCIGKTIICRVSSDTEKGYIEAISDIISKAVSAKPEVSTVKVDVTSDSIKAISSESGIEFSVDGESWQKNGAFEQLRPETEYKVYFRLAETTTHKASPASVINVTTAPVLADPFPGDLPEMGSNPDVQVPVSISIQEPVEFKKTSLLSFGPSNCVFYAVSEANDFFVTNSLEKLDFSEYLYRFLREEGFQRVILVEEGNAVYDVYAYDKQSELLINGGKSTDSSKKKLLFTDRRPIGGQEEPKAETPIKEFGKRLLFKLSLPKSAANVTDADSFGHFIVTHLKNALTGNIKSAVILPLSLLRQEGFLTSGTLLSLKTSLKASRDEHDGANILLVTARQISDLWVLANEDALCEFEPVGNKAAMERQKTDRQAAISDSIVNELKNAGRILVVRSFPGEDEFANLLLRKKIVERKLDSLSYSKIYPLAESIVSRFLKAKNATDSDTRSGVAQSSEFAFESWPNLLLRRFESEVLNNADALCAVMQLTDKMYPRQIIPYQNLPITALSRIVGDVPRSSLSAEESDALFREARTELDAMIGLSSVKKEISQMRFLGNYIFAGNPGTGKTETARLMGKIFKAKGMLTKGQLVEVKAKDLIGEHFGESERKTIEKCQEAMGGVLFVDEAYDLVNTDSAHGEKFPSEYHKAAYKCLMGYMQDYPLCVICAGYGRQMDVFRTADPGMDSRIKKTIYFEDYTDDELIDILRQMAEKQPNVSGLSDSYISAVRAAIPAIKLYERDNFGNARTIRVLLERSIEEHGEDIQGVLTENDMPEEYRKDERTILEIQHDFALATKDIEQMSGMVPLKKLLNDTCNQVCVNRMRNAINGAPGHYIFSGNPGTGKTTVARIMGKAFKALKMLRKGHCVEVKASDLIAGFSGQTNLKTVGKLNEAIGGVLFVDEAYMLAGESGSFERKAYEEIMKFLEDHRSEFCAIFAGYPNEMRHFYSMNPGMQSRVPNVITFPDYSNAQSATTLRCTMIRLRCAQTATHRW